MKRFLLALFVLTPLWSATSASKVQFPTKNTKLLSKNYPGFYMHTLRTTEGVTSRPWQGGTYGFSRNLKKHGRASIATRFHEGIDIKPLSRDSKDVPKDVVKPIAIGKVVYANHDSTKSNYGKYLVIEHETPSGKLYSLYAHLASIWVKTNQPVTLSSKIGRLGYTGRGLNRARAHLHLELNLMYSKRFSTWHNKHYQTQNHHGIYNGINLIGLPIHEILKKGQLPDMRSYAKKLPAYYTITTKRKSKLPSILKNYPWLLDGQRNQSSPSWDITFTGSGIPLKMIPSFKKVDSKYPQVTIHTKSKYPHLWRTKSRISGQGKKAFVTPSGVRAIQLLVESF